MQTGLVLLTTTALSIYKPWGKTSLRKEAAARFAKPVDSMVERKAKRERYAMLAIIVILVLLNMLHLTGARFRGIERMTSYHVNALMPTTCLRRLTATIAILTAFAVAVVPHHHSVMEVASSVFGTTALTIEGDCTEEGVLHLLMPATA